MKITKKGPLPKYMSKADQNFMCNLETFAMVGAPGCRQKCYSGGAHERKHINISGENGKPPEGMGVRRGPTLAVAFPFFITHLAH